MIRGLKLAKRKTEDRIRILKQNAEQILAVVKETFSGYDFNGQTAQKNCERAQSDGELLDCLWSQALVALAAEKRSIESEAIPALMEVRCDLARVALQDLTTF